METTNFISLLTSFVNQRPGLDFSNYGEIKAYRSEMAEISKDLQDFRELLSLAASRVQDLGIKIETYLKSNSGRLTLNESNQLEYVTGQYFQREYRPAASNVLRSLIWADYANETDSENKPVYKDGIEIRKAIKRRVSRRVAKNYFN